MKKVLRFVLALSLLISGVPQLNATCTVRVSCGSNENDFIECSGSGCKRKKNKLFPGDSWVMCDGVKTYCEGPTPE